MLHLINKILSNRSVVFYQHSYYHHHYLCQALRKRGWDAVSVSIESPESVNRKYYHGEDINLFDPNPENYETNLEAFFESALKRFSLMHFAGDGLLSFFPKYYGHPNPPDILRWKAQGRKLAYTTSGCNSGISQKSIRLWSNLDNGHVPLCSHCIHENNPDVCSDTKNLEWGLRVERHCDLIFADTAPALDLLQSYKAIRTPVSSAMNPEIWHPNLEIPEDLRIKREPGEILIYHSFGNFDIRSNDDRNPKGTPAILDAVERLKREGHTVRIVFVKDVANLQVRFVQAQTDIVVDQLHFGRYGATAKECMMLGKPVICYINPHEVRHDFVEPCMQELPLVSATTETVYSVLKDLVLNPAKRLAIGEAGRRFMLKWHSADACAERYEIIYDALMNGKLYEGSFRKKLI